MVQACPDFQGGGTPDNKSEAMTKWVYTFGDGKAEGEAGMRNLLGGKGANLAEMSNLGLPVPPGFTITTEVCTYYYDHNRSYPAELKGEVDKALAYVGRLTGKSFGDPDNPLLVSVRSGARASMPGMMDTILNLGLNDGIAEGLARRTKNTRFGNACSRAKSPRASSSTPRSRASRRSTLRS